MPVALLCAQFALEQLADFLPLDVDSRQDNVTGRAVHQLHDALAEVALHGLDAALFEIGGQAAFLGEHGLALDQVPGSVLAEYSVDCLVVLLSVLGPVYVDTVGHGIALEHLEVVGEVGDGVHLGAGGRIAQGLPLWD